MSDPPVWAVDQGTVRGGDVETDAHLVATAGFAALGLNLDQLTGGTIEANLYRLDRPNDPYRHVLLHPQLGMVNQ